MRRSLGSRLLRACVLSPAVLRPAGPVRDPREGHEGKGPHACHPCVARHLVPGLVWLYGVREPGGGRKMQRL
jgi:hypothetical protein